MALYTNKGLVAHAEKALALKTKYMWGGILREISASYINLLKGIYGTGSGTGYTDARWNELQALTGKGWYGVDCVGLIKSYYWSGRADGGTGSPKYGAAGFPDVNANYMYQQAKKKGKISTMPDIPGLIVYSKSHPHVGIYIGGGETIESTLGSRGDGVVKRKLDSFWEYWFECPYIDYPTGTVSCTKKSWINVGDKVYIRSNAGCYAGTNIAIPAYCKGKDRTYTAAKIMSGRVLIKELFSWVNLNDVCRMQ